MFKSKVLEELYEFNKEYPIGEIIDFVINKPEKNKRALIISHLGLGDNINICGAVRYLENFYNSLYIIAKPHNYENAISFYRDLTSVNVIKGNDDDIPRIINELNCDIFSTSLNENYRTKTGNIFLNSNYRKNNYNSHFLSTMYKNALLDLDIYNNYFYLESTEKSKQLFEMIKNYQIIFVHENSSNKSLDLFSKILDDENEIVICPDRNYYNIENNKFEISNKFIGLKILDYFDVLLNSKKILVVDSCFSSIVVPLVNNGSIKSDDITIFCREGHNYVNQLCSKAKIC